MERIFVDYKQRDILLVPFPFSDQSGNKVRPVLIISNDMFNKKSEDLLVCAITSTIKREGTSIVIEQKNIESGMLHHTCCIKIENILKINKRLILKKIGVLNKATFEKVYQTFIFLF